MKPQLVHTEASQQSYMQAKHSLYNSYAGMLLGYILEIVKNQHTAEQYLADVFADLHQADVLELSRPGTNIFCRLQLLVRKKLSGFFESLDNCNTTETPAKSSNKFINMMSAEQQHVFCGVHYHGKTTAKLACELNKPEDSIRRILKESFTIIRSNRG